MQPEQNRPGRSLFSRFLIVLVIAVFGLISYFSQGQDNPITGKHQYVSLTPNEEIKLGLQSAPQMASEMGGELPRTDPRSLEVQKVGEFVVNNTEAGKGPWQFKFHLLADDQTINAFALPGGQIFITLGLYQKLKTQAQLAGVLSHEVGHVLERHTAEQMAKNQLGKTLVIAIGVGASDSDQGSNAPMMIASFVNQMLQLRYSRKDESEADEWGLKLMEEVGFDPKAMIEVMNVLKAADGGRGSIDMFQTHPNPDLRIEQIEAYIQEHPSRRRLSEGAALPQ